MKAILQRVANASVSIDQNVIAAIQNGLLVLFGIGKDDTLETAEQFIKKILSLRIFPDNEGRMNKSITDVDGEVLLISQFTLYADCRNGNRPSFTNAMPPKDAKEFYNQFALKFIELHSKTKQGVFGAYMKVSLLNDGPVTIILEE